MAFFGLVRHLSPWSRAVTRSMAVVVALCAVPAAALALPLPLGGGGVLVTGGGDHLLGVSNACLNFGYPTACGAGVTTADVIVTGSDPALFVVGTGPLDTIQDVPATQVLPLTSFQTVQSPLGEVFFDLVSFVLPPISAGNNCTTFALNATCTPSATSPFVFTQSGLNQLSVSFSLNERAYTGTSATGSTAYVGLFTFQLAGDTAQWPDDDIPNIVSFISNSGVVPTTWSATHTPVTTSVPEPASLLLVGSGIGAVLRRRRARNAS